MRQEEARTLLQRAQNDLRDVWRQAGEYVDIDKVTRISGEDVSHLPKKEKIRRVSKLGDRVEELRRRASKKTLCPHPVGDGGISDLGGMVVNHSGFKSWLDAGKPGQFGEKFDVSPTALVKGQKALFQTTAGWAPESIRTGQVIPDAVRPVQLLDIFPVQNTSQASVVYMEETTRTHAAAETSEGAAYPEATFQLTERTSPVQKIATSLPVTDEQLEDEQAAEAYINNRLMFGVRQRLDNQILNGDGVSPNLTGILNTSGIQSQAKGSDPVPDAIHKAMTLVRVTGRAEPTAVVLHPNDWEEIRLLTTADGEYIFGSPGTQGQLSIWGVPVVLSDAIAENTGLVGAFSEPWITLFERRGIDVQVGFVGTQFTEGEKTIRADGRWALVVARPEAFATVTGI